MADYSVRPSVSEEPAEYGAKFEQDGELIVVGKMQLNPELPQLSADFLRWKRAYWAGRLKAEGITHVVAPMVDQSELAFRMLLRKHNAHLAFTPMIHAQLFVTNWTYRRQSLATVPADRPLIVQFCANEPDVLLDACRLVEGYCDGVDLNLGCPQIVAKKGHYGSFLQEEPDLVRRMIEKVHRHCRLPLSVKIRCLRDAAATVEYARLCERAGATMLTVHGRRREQRGQATGVADWDQVRAVARALAIPVLANGNVQMPGDVHRCMAFTGANGVMSAEGILSNPLLFAGQLRPGYEVAKEYLVLAERYKASTAMIRAHVFRMCHYSFLRYTDLRERNSYVLSIAEFNEVVDEIRRRCEAENEVVDFDPDSVDRSLGFVDMVSRLPYYLCKPYVRSTQMAPEQAETEYRQQRKLEMEKIQNETGLSFRQIRKRERRRIDMRKEFARKHAFPVCQRCRQPAGLGCENQSCRKCCRFVCVRNAKLCRAHRFTAENLRQKRQNFADQNGLTLEQVESPEFAVDSVKKTDEDVDQPVEKLTKLAEDNGPAIVEGNRV